MRLLTFLLSLSFINIYVNFVFIFIEIHLYPYFLTKLRYRFHPNSLFIKGT